MLKKKRKPKQLIELVNLAEVNGWKTECRYLIDDKLGPTWKLTAEASGSAIYVWYRFSPVISRWSFSATRGSIDSPPREHISLDREQVLSFLSETQSRPPKHIGESVTALIIQGADG